MTSRTLAKMYLNNNWYAVTISPRPYIGNQVFKYRDDSKYIKKNVCKNMSKHYIFYPEFDKADRLHYHGIIRIDDKCKWYKQRRRRMQTLGFMNLSKIKSFTEHLRYLLYCKKDWHINQRVFKKPIGTHI